MQITFDKDYCWFSEFWVDFNYNLRGQGNTKLVIDRTDPDYNAPEKMKAFKQQVYRIADSDRTNHIFVGQGCDFSGVNATQNYEEMEKMMLYWNTQFSDELEIIYSTPSRYFYAIKNENIF